MELKDSMINLCKDQLKVLGRTEGMKYIKTCLDYWKPIYGPTIVEKVAIEMRKAVREMK